MSSGESAYLEKIRQTFQELTDAHMMKKALRSIYSVTQNVSQAEDALLRWVKAAQKIQSDQLHKMAKTILQHWDGILAFREHDQCLYGKVQQQGKDNASTGIWILRS